MTMTRRIAVAWICAALAAGGCGGGDKNAGPDRPAAQGRQGGTLTILRLLDVDTLDPGLTYGPVTSEIVAGATHRPLMSFAPGDDKPRPDLAAEPPQASDGGHTVTVKLRRGVRFAPPVDRDVVAGDVKYAIQRGFTKNVPNPYADAYFGAIAGVDEFRGGAADEIAGIETPDDHTVVFRLSRPAAGTLIGAMVLPLTAAVPPEVARAYDAEEPSTYGDHAVATGPYQVTSRTPGRAIVLERNPSWRRRSDFRPAYLDRVEIRPGNDPRVAVRQALRGRATIAGVEGPPPPLVGRTLEGRQGDQVMIAPAGDTVMLAVDTTSPPFDDVNARRAVAAAFPRAGAIQAFGGAKLADPASHFIAPGVAGFEEAGGFEGTGVDFLANPAGDAKLALRYLEKAALTDAERKIVVVDRQPPGGGTNRAAEFIAGVLEEMGFEVELELVAPSRMSAVCAKQGDACQYDWARDFDDAQTMLVAPFSERGIGGPRPSNVSRYSNPKVERRMREAAALTNPRERAKAWAEIDRLLTEDVAAVPLVWGKTIHIRSKDVVPAINPLKAGPDIPHTSLR